MSVLLYLNPGWDAERLGGELRIFTRNAVPQPQAVAGRVAARAGDGESWIDVSPEGGTLVLMQSDAVDHEVLPTRAPRQALVGWFRTVRSRTQGNE